MPWLGAQVLLFKLLKCVAVVLGHRVVLCVGQQAAIQARPKLWRHRAEIREARLFRDLTSSSKKTDGVRREWNLAEVDDVDRLVLNT